MNKNTRISVDTPVGLTDETDRGEGVGQGTLEGALVSAANLDSGVRDCFKDSEYEVSYGGLGLGPVMYQDDVARLADSVEAAQAGNDRMLTMGETKLLDYNIDKSCFMVIGLKKAKKIIERQLEETPLLLCDVPMKQEECTKCL